MTWFFRSELMFFGCMKETFVSTAASKGRALVIHSCSCSGWNVILQSRELEAITKSVNRKAASWKEKNHKQDIVWYDILPMQSQVCQWEKNSETEGGAHRIAFTCCLVVPRGACCCWEGCGCWVLCESCMSAPDMSRQWTVQIELGKGDQHRNPVSGEGLHCWWKARPKR